MRNWPDTQKKIKTVKERKEGRRKALTANDSIWRSRGRTLLNMKASYRRRKCTSRQAQALVLDCVRKANRASQFNDVDSARTRESEEGQSVS